MNGRVGASQRRVYSSFLICSQNLSLALSKHSGSQPEHRSSPEHSQCTLRPVHAGEEIREYFWHAISAGALLRRILEEVLRRLLRRLLQEGVQRKASHETRHFAKT